MIQPLSNRVLIKTIKTATKTETGLLLPDDPSATHRPQTGEVVAFGSEVKELTMGDTVLYSLYGHEAVTVDDVDHVLVTADNILAIV